MKKKVKSYPLDIEVTISIKRKRNHLGKKKWFVYIGEDTPLSDMHNFGSSPKIGIQFPFIKLFGFDNEEAAIACSKQAERYISDFLSTPQHNRPGSTKYWYRK